MKTTLFCVCALVLLAGLAWADVSSDSAAYPLATCIVCGETLGEHGEPVGEKIEDREIRFCCIKCVATFHEDEASWLEKIDATIVAAQTPNYPLETCLMSGRKLGSTRPPVNHLVGNRLVRLCDPRCAEYVDANPAAAIAELDAAVVAAQGPGYTATTCPISGRKLGSMGHAVELVFNGELVKLCCPNCVVEFYADPFMAMAALDPDQSEQRGGHGDQH